MDGHEAVASRMQRKAGQWARGNRKEPDPNGQWNGMHSSRGPQLKKDLSEIFWKSKTEPKAEPVAPKMSARRRGYHVFAQGSRGEIKDYVKQYRQHVARKPADSAPAHVKSKWQSELDDLRNSMEDAKADYGKWTSKANKKTDEY